MTFDKDATVNVNELLNQFKSHCYDVSYLRKGGVANADGMTLEDFERILKEATFRDLRQKVISGLEHCTKNFSYRDCEGCPYYENSSCISTLQCDSLKVLK